jgi:hypothetical protein
LLTPGEQMIAVQVEECRSRVHAPSVARELPVIDRTLIDGTLIDATKAKELTDNRGTD